MEKNHGQVKDTLKYFKNYLQIPNSPVSVEKEMRLPQLGLTKT